MHNVVDVIILFVFPCPQLSSYVDVTIMSLYAETSHTLFLEPDVRCPLMLAQMYKETRGSEVCSNRDVSQKGARFRERKLNTNSFFSNLSGAFGLVNPANAPCAVNHDPWSFPWRRAISHDFALLCTNFPRLCRTFCDFVLGLFGAFPVSTRVCGICNPRSCQQNPGISRPKPWFLWISRDVPNFLLPTHSRGRPPSHPKISGPKRHGWNSFRPIIVAVLCCMKTVEESQNLA